MQEISTLDIFDPSSQDPSMFGRFEGEQQSLEMGHSPPSIMPQPLFNSKSFAQENCSAHHLDSSQFSCWNPSCTGTPQVSQRHTRHSSSTSYLPTNMVPNESAAIMKDLSNASYQQRTYNQQFAEFERSTLRRLGALEDRVTEIDGVIARIEQRLAELEGLITQNMDMVAAAMEMAEAMREALVSMIPEALG